MMPLAGKIIHDTPVDTGKGDRRTGAAYIRSDTQ
jgi:hypothetical protein